MPRYTEQQRQDSLNIFKNYMAGGKNSLFILVKDVSRSGMTRTMSAYRFFGATENYEDYAVNLNYHIARILNLRQDKYDYLVVQGCGMDMTFWLKNSLELATGLEIRHQVL